MLLFDIAILVISTMAIIISLVSIYISERVMCQLGELAAQDEEEAPAPEDEPERE